jgi:hypothetical protein
MTTPSIVNRFVAIFLINIILSTVGCAKNDEQQSGGPSIPQPQVNSASTPGGANQENQTFGVFLSEFSNFVREGDMEGLADMTEFPLTIRGELDDEGSLEIDRKRFVDIIDEFFREKVYLTINDELVASTYRDLMINPMDKPEIDGDTAELHGFHFVRKNQHWKLKQITTYAHVVEQLAQGGGK